MRTVKILQGVPGSGKSTWAKKNFPEAKICSADDFFMKDGEYKFDPSLLSEAHAACLRKFISYRSHDVDLIVDNTNTTVAEIAPYYSIGEAFGGDVVVVQFWVDSAFAHSRNIHNVPYDSIVAMNKRMSHQKFPPWWKTMSVSGGHFDYVGSRISQGLDSISEDPEAKEEWPEFLEAIHADCKRYVDRIWPEAPPLTANEMFRIYRARVDGDE